MTQSHLKRRLLGLESRALDLLDSPLSLPFLEFLPLLPLPSVTFVVPRFQDPLSCLPGQVFDLELFVGPLRRSTPTSARRNSERPERLLRSKLRVTPRQSLESGPSLY